MHTLHHYDYGTCLFVIEAGQDRIGHPFVDSITLNLRQCVDRFERIINYDDTPASSCEGAAYRGCEAKSPAREFDFAFAVFKSANAGVREGLAVPGAINGRAEV